MTTTTKTGVRADTGLATILFVAFIGATLLFTMFFVIRYRGGSNRTTASLLLLLCAGLISLGIAYQDIQAEAWSSCEVVDTSAAGSCGGTEDAASAQCG